MASKSNINYHVDQIQALAKRLADVCTDVRPGTPESDRLNGLLTELEAQMVATVGSANILVTPSRNR